MNIPEGLSTLDPAFARSRAPIWMTAQIFNGLVSLDSALQITPAIAKSWQISADAQTYTFTLRPDVFFHKHPAFGLDSTRRVKAQDVVYSFTRICDPKTASTGKWIFADRIAGLSAYLAGETHTISGFQALDDSTFQLTLSQPFPALLGLLAMPYGYIVPEEVVNALGTDFQSQPIGTGPFQFYRWDEGNLLVLHRNPQYFERDGNRSLPYLSAVRVQFIPSLLSAFIELQQGNLDFIGDLDGSYKDEILTYTGEVKPPFDTAYQVLLAPQLNTEYLGFQLDDTLMLMTDHPLRDLRVRQAINYAIDRDQLVTYLLNGMGYPATSGFMPKGMPGFAPDRVKGYTYQPQLAESLLAEAGHPGGSGIPPLDLYATAKYQNMMVFVQKSLERIGLQVTIQNMQAGALRKEIYGNRSRFWRASWIADYPEGENYMSLFYSPNAAPKGPNTPHFSDATFDQLYEATLREPSDSLRRVAYQQMDQAVMDQAAIVALYYDRSFRLLQKGWTGLGSNPMNHLFLKRVKWADQQ